MEKSTAFGLPFFYRLALPGAVAAVLALPLIVRILPQLGVRQDDLAAGVIGLGLFVGFILDNLDDEIYKIYEGIRWWPSWLRRWRTSRWQSHVKELREKADATKDP